MICRDFRLTFDVDGERRSCEKNHQRLAAEDEEEQAAESLTDDDLFHV